jgi:hypothetical protein
MARAAEATGLSDFGAPTFVEGLEVFIDSANRDAHLTAAGAIEVGQTVARRLRNRLEIEDWYRHHPEIEDLTIEQPLLITGLPRTGTSALASVLSLEPSYRPLRAWEIEQCCPPPILGEEEHDPRRVAMKEDLERLEQTDPDQLVMHIYELDSTAEDVSVLGLDFKAQTATVPVFGYHEWWRNNDLHAGYSYQRRVARLLQSRRGPNRWLFKAPHYVFHLDAVVAAYPDARFVVPHRDPVKALPSWTSLVTSVYPTGWEKCFTPQQIGPKLAHHQAIGMSRMIEYRQRIGEDRFLDVHHRDFVADPMGTIERIYDFVGLDLAPATATRMEAWNQENAMGAKGRHRYTPEQYGLDVAGLRRQFLFYTDRYEVPLEG